MSNSNHAQIINRCRSCGGAHLRTIEGRRCCGLCGWRSAPIQKLPVASWELPLHEQEILQQKGAAEAHAAGASERQMMRLRKKASHE